MTRFGLLGAFVLLHGCEPSSLAGSWFEEDLLENAGFDNWRCDDPFSPCAWEVEGAGVAQSNGWNQLDSTVRLSDGPTTLRQVAEIRALTKPNRCLQLDVLVDGPGTQLWLDVDFDADGSVESTTPLPGGDWQRTRFRLQAPFWLGYLGVALRYEGSAGSETRIGHLRAAWVHAADCDVVDFAQPLGTPCVDPDHCDSGMCADVTMGSWPVVAELPRPPDVCSECEFGAHCGPGEVCGAAWSDLPRSYRTCVPQGSAGLGETCGTDGECDTGSCCHGRCSECCDGHAPCGDGGVCRPRIVPVGIERHIVGVVCDAGPRFAGEACLHPADCDTSQCTGDTLKVCDVDGRPCSTDLDCPDAGRCLGVAVRDGVCE